MKIYINDENGSRMIAAMNLDGSPAVEGQDYVLFEEGYVKNGKWSYKIGGIGAKTIAYSVLIKSTHTTGNLLIGLYIVKDDVEVERMTLPRMANISSRPVFKGEYKQVFDALLDTHLDTWAKIGPDYESAVIETRARWEKNSKFF